jgi:hypothetical protein
MKSSTIFIPTSGDARQIMLLYQFRRWVTSASIVFECSNRRLEEAAQWGAPYFVLISDVIRQIKSWRMR